MPTERLVTQFGIAEHDAGDEGAHREGEPERVRQRPHTHAGSDHRHQKQLARAPPDHVPEQRRQDSGADENHRQHEASGDETGAKKLR
jgi:hypothetical protein